MALWTTSCHYFATGEGMSMMAQITCAKNEQQALDKFSERFGNWFVQGADAAEGVVRNEVIEFVFSTRALDFCDKQHEKGDAYIDVHASVHFNLS